MQGEKKPVVMGEGIINDLTTGGASAALSAEMGKTLEDKKLDKSGGTITGPLFLSGGGKVDAADGTMVISGENAAELAQIEISASTGALNFGYGKKDYSDWQGSTVYHSGNKPGGQYVGGITTLPISSLQSAGDVLSVVTDAQHIALVTWDGAIIAYTVSGSGNVSTLSPEEANYRGGVLALNTQSAFVNAPGVTYYYQVL